jgi:hypothetical protein
MVDLSFDPIADVSAIAALLLTLWQGRKGSSKKGPAGLVITHM